MSRTRSVYFASNYQPRLILERILRLPWTMSILYQLQQGETRPENLRTPTLTTRRRLQQLVQVGLVRSYQIGHEWRFRLRKLPPAVEKELSYFGRSAA